MSLGAVRLFGDLGWTLLARIEDAGLENDGG
jgi:hypothetical protein